MKGKINRLFSIIVAILLVLFSIIFIYIHRVINIKMYNTKTWLLFYPTIIIISFVIYFVIVYPFIKEFDYRLEKLMMILKSVNNEFDFFTTDRTAYDNLIEMINAKIKSYKEKVNQSQDELLSQLRAIMAKNLELIYNISKSKNEKEIEGLAKSLLDILDFGAYDTKIFVPLIYEVLYFENVLFGGIYSDKNSFEIILDIRDERTKKALVLHGILSSIAKVFSECNGKPKPIKNILQLSAIILNNNLNIRIYYNNILENNAKNIHILESLKQRLALYYQDGTYKFNYSEGTNYFVIEFSVPYIEMNENI